MGLTGLKKGLFGGTSVSQQAEVEILRNVADCNFDIRSDAFGEINSAEIRASLSTMVGNLLVMIKQTKDCATGILRALPNIGALANQSDEYSILMDSIRGRFDDLVSAIEKNTSLTKALATVVNDVGANTGHGKAAVGDVVRAMDNISHHSAQISEFTGIVDQIAFQTNLLALNAAVEAARAGDHGRGFAVVASEVRVLAQRSAEAAKQISSYVGRSVDSVAEGREAVITAEKSIGDIAASVATLEQLIQSVSDTTGMQERQLTDVTAALGQLSEFGEKNLRMSREVSELAHELEYDADYLVKSVETFHVPPEEFSHPLHQEICEYVQDVAVDIGRLLEQGLRSGMISEAGLFDPRYEPIPGTSPQKFHTEFDGYTDQCFPAIQDPLLGYNPAIIFAFTVDMNGYVPTHNLIYSNPLTGDRDRDIIGNRTKRIFDDHVGSTAGRSSKPYILQIYRRDTGVIMFDMSAPVYVNGQHWGGFRVGYRINE